MLIFLWFISDMLLLIEGLFFLIVYVGIVVFLLVFWMWVKGIDVIGVDFIVMFMNLLFVFFVFLVVILLGEKVYFYYLIGGLLVISGVVLL